MKLPRWLVATLLSSSALLVVGTAGWYWATWPARVACEFIDRLASPQIDIREIMSQELQDAIEESQTDLTEEMVEALRTPTPYDQLRSHSRSLLDALRGLPEKSLR
jgi:hypothetical protein